MNCWFWDGKRCHYEPVVLGYGGPCADCPDEETAISTLSSPPEVYGETYAAEFGHDA